MRLRHFHPTNRRRTDPLMDTARRYRRETAALRRPDGRGREDPPKPRPRGWIWLTFGD